MTYAYEGEKIKLNQKDYDKICQLYQNLNVRAELDQLDMEIREEKNWFMTLNAKLNYRNRNAPKRQIAHTNGNVSHLNRTTREIPLEEELNDRTWGQGVLDE